MGIVNINTDSFSGDGDLNIDRTLEGMIEKGADIIDAGGESARTNREAISEQEEIDRVAPMIDRFSEAFDGLSGRDEASIFPPLLSINTWRPAVAKTLLSHGGHILNDMGGLPDDRNARICAATGAACVIMHTVGLPKVPHTHIQYPDVLRAVHEFFEEKCQIALNAGLAAEQIILDPGFDFAKQKTDNLMLYRHFESLTNRQYSVLAPVSRKTVIGEVLNLPDPKERDPGTIACVIRAANAGAAIVRVHNVDATYQALRVMEQVEKVEV
jgi:dihydropteroate synthase